jgi:hypothetical protein
MVCHYLCKVPTISADVHVGPVVRTAPNEVSFGTCNAAKDIFAVGKGFHKTMFYSVFPPKVRTTELDSGPVDQS